MNMWERKNKKGDKIYFHYDYGRAPGQRPSSGIFVYTKPKDQTERNHNKEARALLAVKKSQLTIEQQAIGSKFIPHHKFKANFLDYYEEYAKLNKRPGNRHMEGSLNHFKAFIKKDFISPVDITENFCKRFRQYLLDHFSGETPANYYARFKWTLKAATKDGYFINNPTEDVKTKSNPSTTIKEILEVEDYLALLQTPCLNAEVKEGFIFSCYTALRYVDVESMKWKDYNNGRLVTRMIQAKTGQPVVLTLHPIARAIMEKRQRNHPEALPEDRVFSLPTLNGCNAILDQWIRSAAIEKYITWSCARLSFSILLQDKRVDDATIAALMGHTTTDQVRKNYKRHRPKDQTATINKLPTPAEMPYFLQS